VRDLRRIDLPARRRLAVAGVGLYLVLGVVSLFAVGWVRDPLVGLIGLRAETGTAGWAPG
jgi:hypothetical protein